MSKIRRAASVLVATAVLGVACAKVPYTGRSQFNAIPEGVMNDLGKQAFQELVASSKIERGTPDAERLASVTKRISSVANKPDYAWRSVLIEDPSVNAFALPGGYIGFYEGILPILENEAGMAFVMGHEVGHAIAKHGAERMSQQLGITGALTLIDMFLSGGTGLGPRDRNAVMGAIGLGAQVGVTLPFSRTHEKEADVIGLMMMADAGYPPKAASGVWDRMEKVSGRGGPAWLSTHPSYEARRELVKEYMPQAAKRYARSGRGGDGTLVAIW